MDVHLYVLQGAIDGEPRREVFEDPEFHEVFTVVDFNIKVAKTEEDPEHQTRCIIHFEGVAKNHQSTLEGYVRLTPEGHVRWRFVSPSALGRQDSALILDQPLA